MRRQVSLLLSEQLSQSAAAQHLGQLFFVVVAGFTSATYYNFNCDASLSCLRRKFVWKNNDSYIHDPV